MLNAGTYPFSATLFQKQVDAAHEVYSDAELDKNRLGEIKHSRCGKWLKMDTPYSVKALKKHIRRGCKEKQEDPIVDANRKLDIWVDVVTTSDSGCGLLKICPGITKALDPRIEYYLMNTGTHGGGSKSKTSLAESLFGVESFKKLSHTQRSTVRYAQKHARMWICHRGRNASRRGLARTMLRMQASSWEFSVQKRTEQGAC